MENLSNNIDEIVLDSDSKIEMYFDDDAYRTFMREAGAYPVLTPSENMRLANEAREGNLVAREKLVNSNLRLVAYVANKYKNRIKHLQILDIIQEGVIGLINCINGYDSEKGTFSTYAFYWIKQAIGRAISNLDHEIRLPVHMEDIINKYKRLLFDSMANNMPTPNDEEICQKLNISKETLFYIQREANSSMVSLDQRVNDEDSETELGAFVGVEEERYDKVLEDMSVRDLCLVIKEVLSEREYYIIFHRYLSDVRMSLEEIGEELLLSRERVRQIEEKSLSKITKYMDKNGKYYKGVLESLLNKCQNLDLYNYRPISPHNVVLFFYLKNDLSEEETQLLYYELFGKFRTTYYISSLGISKNEFGQFKKTIANKISAVGNDLNDFRKYKKEFLNIHGSKIFQLLKEFDLIYSEGIKEFFDNLTFDEVLDLFSKQDIELTEDEENILKRYFIKPAYSKVKKELLEREIYLSVFGYRKISNEVSKKKLLKTFLNNAHYFTEEQILCLECFYFGLKNISVFIDKYPDSAFLVDYRHLVNKLELIHYNIYDLLSNTFNKEKYLYVKKKHFQKLSKERIELLDLYYGINGRAYTIKEIAQLMNEDYILIHYKIRNAREACINLYTNSVGTLMINSEIYEEYLHDNTIMLTDETRCLLKMFIIDKLDYLDIQKLTGFTRYRISNIITEGIRKLDFYRFNIIQRESVNSKDLEEFFDVYEKDFSAVEQKIIFLRKINLLSPEEVSEKTKVSKKDIIEIISKFNRFFFRYQVRDVSLENEYLQQELNCHPSESVIDEKSEEILSLYYGVKTKYNEEGIKLTSDEIKDRLGLTLAQFYHKFYNALDNVKGKKIGILRNDIVYISRGELDCVLDDIHVPISAKEREIICYLFGLKKYPYKKLEELVEIFNDTKGSIKRRYQRAILNIYKYKNREIDGFINYEMDIVPILKYFSKSDINIIEDYYKNGLTYELLVKKYNFTFNQVVIMINRIKNAIYDLLHEENTKCFDYEFYRNEKHNPKLPYYGDVDLAIQILDLYFGEIGDKKLSVPEIIEKLKLTKGSTAVHAIISDFMLGCCKFKDGIEKVHVFTDREIREYYNKHHLNMNWGRKQSYLTYFGRMNNQNSKYISDVITFDLLKEQYPTCFNIDCATSMQVYTLLKKYYMELPNNIRECLMHMFNLSERDFMLPIERCKVYKILSKLEIRENLKGTVPKRKNSNKA